MPKIYARQLQDAGAELAKALRKYPKMHGPHEGYAVILEELDELKLEIWKKPKKRSLQKMRKEAVQIAAMALRFMLDVCDK
jgi:hypothetical protein